MKMKAVVVVALKFITKKDLVRQIMLTILKMKWKSPGLNGLNVPRRAAKAKGNG